MGCFAVLIATSWPHLAKGVIVRHPRQEQTLVRSSVEPPPTGEKRKVVVTVTEVCNEGLTGEEEVKQSRNNSHESYAKRCLQPLTPVIQDMQTMIEGDALIRHLLVRMFQEIPHDPPFEMDPSGNLQVRNYEEMLRRLDEIITRAPDFSSTATAGFPINALLAWPMATPSGKAAFLQEKINVQIRKILNAWAVFLSSPESTHVLNDDPERGWFGPKALARMPNFAEDYVCDPVKPHFGFESWDAFFTRKLREGVRPVEFPHNTGVIANACESTPYRVAHGVKLQDRFWLKDQSYSLQDMLAGDPLTPKFEGGSVYQAYLGCTNYHRWHSPVSGIVRKAYRQAGAYYAQSPAVDFDRLTPNASQAYLTHVATRAMIFIEADHPGIGLVCFMPVGMAECSTCEITVSAGQSVKRGDQLGMFHYGGSTYCLIFRPETRLRFREEATKCGGDASTLLVNSALAFVDYP